MLKSTQTPVPLLFYASAIPGISSFRGDA